MSLLRRLACLVRGGHRWETTSDIAGSITTCARCGKLVHVRTESPDQRGYGGGGDSGGGGDGGDF